jgi:DnaK suppressor protein
VAFCAALEVFNFLKIGQFMKAPLEIEKQPSLKQRRAALEAKLKELTIGFQDRSGLHIENSADMVDTICMATDRDVLVQQMNVRARMQSDVRKAIATLEEGEYCVCEDCEDAISPRRLDAIPWTRVCVKCQERRDSRAVDFDDNLIAAA